MARPKAEIPAYRVHHSGQARVTINGIDHYLGPHGTKASKLKYDRIIAEYLASGRSPSFGVAGVKYTVAMLIRDYLVHAKAYYGTGRSSEWHRIKNAVKPLKTLYAAANAAEFSPDQFKAVRQVHIDSGLARSTINAHMKRIVRMFKWAAANDKLPASVHATLSLIDCLKRGRTKARETGPIKPVAKEIVEATLLTLPQVVADMVRLQLLAGCRPSEVCKLTPAMIDRSGEVWEATLGEHKTAHHGHTRTIYFGPQAKSIVQKYLNRDEHETLFRPIDTAAEVRARRKAERIAPPSSGNREGTNRKRNPKHTPGLSYDTPAYARAITRAAKAAGVAHWSPNQLRHSRGTLIRKQFGLEAAKTILGHSEITTTQIYAEEDREKAIEVARQIG